MRTRTAPRIRLLLIWILLELVAAAQVYGPDGSSVLVSWMRSLIQPVESVVSVVLEGAESLQERISSRDALVEKNLQLSRENQELRLSLLFSQNNARALLQADEALRLLPEFGGIPARVLSRSSGLLRLETVKGHQVHDDDPVMSAAGILGRVIRVEGKQVWVEELVSPSAAIGIQSEDGRIQGLARGLGGVDLSLLYIPQQADLSIGQLLLSSGSDGVYPPGLPVARVASISESRSPFLHVRARSLAAPDDLRALRILVFSRNPEEE